MALVGLEEAECAALAALCGDPRQMADWLTYKSWYSQSETDLVVARRWDVDEPGVPAHLMAIDPVRISRLQFGGSAGTVPAINSEYGNTERELRVSRECPERYRALAVKLVRDLAGDDWPAAELGVHPDVPSVSHALVETSSGHPVALRSEFQSWGSKAGALGVVLALPEGAELVPWFRAFLADVHEADRGSVPRPLPRLATPQDWYTPSERCLAARIMEIDDQVDLLQDERRSLKAKLDSEEEVADAGPRRAVWENGKQLEAAVHDVLCEFGFTVQEMDAEVPEGEPRREDFRLTHPDLDGWEALVEVKGYSDGTKTNDAQQVVRHRNLYIKHAERVPDLTLWVTNTHRHLDPSDRPRPDDNVNTAAESIDAVHVLSTDLYRLWTMIADGRLDAAAVVDEMCTAEPGTWEPSALR